MRSTFQSETKVGASDPLYVHLYMNVGSTAQTDKSYPGLALMAKESGKLGLILLDAKRAAKHIAEIL